ncbi:MAG: CoA transferase [Streptosporangiaceae bacterium]|nr:CoA transferase [Streptosporangiaceae bacterium]
MGPLDGITVIEVAGLGAAPFGCMVLADLGADVLRVIRPPGAGGTALHDLMGRSKRSVAVDLRTAEGRGILLRLARDADVLVESFRPGVAERLGFGPQPCLEANPRLVYARLTGWGQEGPLAGTAGHDIDYIAISGALSLIGPAGQPPVPPVNLVGDFGGGGMLLVAGVLAALVERGRSGRGQVIDAAMTDGSALLTTMIHELRAAGQWSGERGANLLDGGAPWYGVYQTADGRYLAVGAIEGSFYAELLARLGLAEADLPDRSDRRAWPALRERLAAAFRQRTQGEWLAVFEGSDACVAPVLGIDEAAGYPHNARRATFTEVAGVPQPSPAPRFSRTPAAAPRTPPAPGADTGTVLADLGYSQTEIAQLRDRGVVG